MGFTTHLPVLLFLSTMVFLQGGAQATTTWRVGGTKGWKLNVDYGIWTQGKVFELDDLLLFVYNKSEDNVLQVSKADYQSCTTASPLVSYDDGNSSVPLLLNRTTYFFISGTPGHCFDGMTLQIPVGLQSAPSPLPAISPASLAPTSPPSSTTSLPLGTPQTSVPPSSVPSATRRHRSMLAGAAALLLSLGTALIL